MSNQEQVRNKQEEPETRREADISCPGCHQGNAWTTDPVISAIAIHDMSVIKAKVLRASAEEAKGTTDQDKKFPDRLKD